MSHEKSIVERYTNITSNENKDYCTKLYIFKSYVDCFKTAEYALQMLSRNLIQTKEGPEIMADPHVFGIALAFGYKKDDKPVEGIDIFSARLRDGWHSNPMYDSWTFENGVYVPREKGTTCGTGMIILGKEEELRRKTKDRESFLNVWPDIGNIFDSDF